MPFPSGWTAIDEFDVDQLYAYQDVNELVKNVISLASLRPGLYDLGGSTDVGLQVASFTSGILPNWRRPSIDGANLDGFTKTAIVWYRTDDVGTAVDWQIVDYTADPATPILSGSAYSASANWQKESLAITLNASDHEYELQIKGSNANAAVFGHGRIEVYANA